MARAIIKGLPLSPGIAVGALRLLADGRICEQRAIEEEEIAAEQLAIREACEEACASLEEIRQQVPENISDFRDIVSAQLELLRDPRIIEGAIARVQHKKICATWAITETITELTALFQGMVDPYWNERAQDIRSAGRYLIDTLTGSHRSRFMKGRGIVAAWDISPATFFDFNFEDISGLITVDGGTTSHLAILARALKIPAIAGAEKLFQEASNGERIIVDGSTGTILIDPEDGEVAHYQQLSQKQAEFEKEAQEAAQWLSITRDGKFVPVFANIDNPQELPWFEGSGAEGIGLYRTEFSYFGNKLPTEEKLLDEYGAIISSAGDQPVIFRTLDAGADKILPLQEALHEPNPALGLRGVRLCLNRTDIFKTQLRAILRAGTGARFSLMIPMVTEVEEVEQVKGIIREVEAELAIEGLPHAEQPQLGIMLETPAAIFIAGELARRCDFISLGTNDLLHYLMAIDRNNRHVSYLHEPFHAAFIRALKKAIEAVHAEGRKVCVCGELAADPLGVALLVGLDVDSFSVTPRFIPSVKHLLRKLDARLCKQITEQAIQGDDPGVIKEKLRKLLAESKDADLLFGNSIALCHTIRTSQGEAEAFFSELMEHTRT